MKAKIELSGGAATSHKAVAPIPRSLLRGQLHLFTENFFWQGRLKNAVKRILGRGGRGPEAVAESLQRGLTKLHQDFVVNKAIDKPIEAACVLNGAEVLEQLVLLKRAGMIKKLIAGPNIVLSPNDHGGLLTRREIDVVLTPSEQTRINYGIISPGVKDKTKVWFAGVDENFWCPYGNGNKNSVLVYHKIGDKNFSNLVEKTISKYGWNIISICYGKYTPKEYKDSLAKSSFAVFISKGESQGIALAESWSMNVPTIVWNPLYPPKTMALNLIPSTSCPYLNALNGLDWKKIGELEIILSQIKNILGGFKPREWILNNMTDIHSAKLLLDIVRIDLKNRF